MTEQEKKEFIQSEFYDVELECTNCGSSPNGSINIPTGAYWDVYLYEIKYKCSCCGCHSCMTRV